MSYDNELYQQVILDHNRKPRNFHEMENSTNSCHGINPLCGDDITIYLKLDEAEGVIQDISFTGSGCAISKASTSLMTQYLKGKKVDESRLIFEEFHKMVLGDFDPEKQEHHLGKLTLFMGIESTRRARNALALHGIQWLGRLTKSQKV